MKKKMKTLRRNAVALVLALVLMLSPMQVFAEEIPTEAVYDMELGGTQTFLVRDEDGNVGTVTVRELSGDSRIANGEYEVIYDNTGVWIASFTIAISSNKIYNAHSPFNYALIGTIKYPVLTRPSTTQATYAFIYEYNLMNFTTGVDAKIINGDVVITKR